MREIIARAIFIKRIVVWAVVFCCCVFALSIFARELAADLSAGEEIFIPGVTVLVCGVVLILAVSVRFLIKNIRRYAEKE